jgi:hypothetical protein
MFDIEISKYDGIILDKQMINLGVKIFVRKI